MSHYNKIKGIVATSLLKPAESIFVYYHRAGIAVADVLH